MMPIKKTRGRTGLVVLALSALALVASACASIGAAQGPYKVGRGMTVDLPVVWSDITHLGTSLPYLRILTREGPSLDMMVLSDAIRPGQALGQRVTRGDVRQGRTQIPLVRAGMSELELVEFVTDSLAVNEMQKVEATDITPAMVAGIEGVAFGFTASTTAGLELKGLARAAQRPDGSAYFLIFYAANEHYFPILDDQVVQIFDSARF